MRKILSTLFLVCSLIVVADEYTIFEKDGYFGIIDQTGNVTVPAVYEKLGWSDGSTKVQNGVVGFKENNLWGLITVRNKALTGQKFYTIEPIAPSQFKASIKGKFSNRLFFGILDEKGKTIVSFNHFSVEPIGPNWLVSDFDGKRQRFGVVSYENQVLVPKEFLSVIESNNLFVCKEDEHKLSLFNRLGENKQLGIDSLQPKRNGWVAFRDGYAGYLSISGESEHDFTFKNIRFDGNSIYPIEFPEWTIFKDDTVSLKWRCDSLSVSQNDLLIAHLNGSSHFIINNEILLENHDLVLKEVDKNLLIVQNSKTRKWSLLSAHGKEILQGYDTIHSIGNLIAARSQMGWNLFSNVGKRVNRFSFQAIGKGVNKQLIAKRNDHWGILDDLGIAVTTFKYDSIVSDEALYFVSYLNRWGAMDHQGEWVIHPEFSEITSIADFLVGRRGKGYTLFKEGQQVYKTADRPTKQLGPFMIVQSPEGELGLFNEEGQPFVPAIYSDIKIVGNKIILNDEGHISMMDFDGSLIISSNEGYQKISSYGEGYFLVAQGDRWGMVDEQGRLRVSNRYDSVWVFQNGMAPIKLRDKWGFIDKKETLKVQPYYNKVSPYQNGMAVVQLDDKFGLIDMEGKEVLELIWKSVLRLKTGNYLVQDIDGRIGLVSDEGSFILRPAYDDLRDFGDRILVSKSGLWGVMDYFGSPIFKINHEEIKVIGNLTMIKN